MSMYRTTLIAHDDARRGDGKDDPIRVLVTIYTSDGRPVGTIDTFNPGMTRLDVEVLTSALVDDVVAARGAG